MKINIKIRNFIATDSNIIGTMNRLYIIYLGFIIIYKKIGYYLILLLNQNHYFLVNAQNKNITIETFELTWLRTKLHAFGIAGDVIKTIYLVQNKENKIGISLSVVIDRLIGLFSMLMIF